MLSPFDILVEIHYGAIQVRISARRRCAVLRLCKISTADSQASRATYPQPSMRVSGVLIYWSATIASMVCLVRIIHKALKASKTDRKFSHCSLLKTISCRGHLSSGSFYSRCPHCRSQFSISLSIDRDAWYRWGFLATYISTASQTFISIFKFSGDSQPSIRSVPTHYSSFFLYSALGWRIYSSQSFCHNFCHPRCLLASA